MTYRTSNGLTFKVWSPSLWELVGSDNHISLVTVAYSGLGQWYVDIMLRSGRVHTKGPYRSREHAINVICTGQWEQRA